MKISDLTKEEILAVVNMAIDLKEHKDTYSSALKGKTLLMLFEKPSLRTRVSFETGMTQLGGHAIMYSIADSPLGKKETFSDTGRVLSRMADIIMARVNKRTDIGQLADNCTIPVINALDDFAHPCQMLADLMCIMQHKISENFPIESLKMAYCGDIHNNVTYDLMRLAAVVGFEIRVAGPDREGYEIEQQVIDECNELCKKSGGKVIVTHDAKEACAGVDVVYNDSWMSYGISKSEEAKRFEIFMPYQVNAELMKCAKPNAIFMNCLPAQRGAEVTAEVIDGPQSVVFDEAENRLHTCKALMLFLLGKMSVKTSTKCCCNKPKRILIALGGNALLQRGEKGTWEEAQKNANVTAESIAKLVKQGNEMVITHGNGPQVGSIKLQNQIAADKVPDMNLFVCGAQSQGYLGFLLAQTLQNVFQKQGINRNVVSVVTQTRVDRNDPAFQNPTKPIGRFYTKEEADVLIKEGKNVVEDAGRGYRVVVPSPMPIDIIEGPALRQLVDGGNVVISTGGGGIPVIKDENGQLVGIEAVIDKDLGASVLANLTKADLLMILTDVECAYADFRGPNKRALRHLTVAEAEELAAKGEFAKGSMGPKIQAAIRFVKASGKEAIITSLDKVEEALADKVGTKITP